MKTHKKPAADTPRFLVTAAELLELCRNASRFLISDMRGHSYPDDEDDFEGVLAAWDRARPTWIEADLAENNRFGLKRSRAYSRALFKMHEEQDAATLRRLLPMLRTVYPRPKVSKAA